jgi:hypothetical protein
LVAMEDRKSGTLSNAVEHVVGEGGRESEHLLARWKHFVDLPA